MLLKFEPAQLSTPSTAYLWTFPVFLFFDLLFVAPILLENKLQT